MKAVKAVKAVAVVPVFCNGMSNFGARFADPCGWSGSSADAQYILDERRCPKCGGELLKASLPIAPILEAR